MCTHCLHKGIECEWDEGGQGESERYICYEFILIFNDRDCQNMFIEVTACMWHLIM